MTDQIYTSLFEKHFDGLDQRKAAQRSTQLILGTGNPEDVTEAVRLGAELGVPPQAVQGAPEIFRTQSEQIRATTALQSAPSMQQWLGDPINGALAKDDLDNLTWFESNLGPAARAVGRGTRRISAAPDYMSAGADAVRAGDVGKTFDEILSEEMERSGAKVFEQLPASMRVNALQVAELRYNAIAGQGEAERIGYIRRGAESLASANRIIEVASAIPMSDIATAFRDGTLSNAPNTFMGTLGAFVDDPIAGAAFIAETAAETLPVLAAATAATIATGSPMVGALTMGAGSFLIENTSAGIQFLQEKGVDLSTPAAAALVLQDRELFAEARALGAERGVIIALFDAMSGGVAGQTLLKNPAGEVVVQGLAQMILGGGGEATAQLATTGELDMREVVIEGLAELATAPVEVLGVGGRGFMQEIARRGRSGETAAVIAEIDETSSTSLVRDRSQDKFLEALQSAGLEDQALYVPADDLQEYFQAKDIDLDDETLRAWGVDPADFRVKVLSNGDISVPVSNYAARISGTDDAQWFRENAVFTLDEMSVAEAAAFNERAADVMDQEFERAEGERESELAARADDVKIEDGVFSGLRSAGRSPDVAKAEASVWGSFFRSMSDKFPSAASDLAKMMGVKIQGPQTPEISRRRDQMDVMLNTLRSQGEKALAPRGNGILDFVRDQGGVQDRGGDIEALDVPKGIISETRGQVVERESQPNLGGAVDFSGRGRGLDELGRAMIEAGYFPEHMGGADVQADGAVVDEAAIALEAISEAVAGRDRFIEGEGPDQGLSEFSDLLSERGIDLAMSNDEVMAALQVDDNGRAMFQEDYRGMHTAPTNDEGNASLVGLNDVFGDDIYGPNAQRYFGTGDAIMDRDTIKIIQEAMSDPDSPITIYRAIPKDVGGEINAGDWVTINRSYADQHGEYFGEYDIIEMEALPSEVFSDGNSIHEFGYDPNKEGETTELFQSAAIDVEAFARELKDRLGLRDLHLIANGDDLKVNMIAVEKKDQRQGVGSQAMTAITEFADQHGMRVVLTTGQKDDGFGTTSAARLKRFYKRFGFVENKGRNKDFAISENMYREPRLNQEKRGSIILPRGGLKEGETVINLFESADLSTFLHESGHFFLEAFTALATSEDAPQALRDDLAVIHKFLNVEDGAKLETEQHETWARGFEQYFMEGNAPSLGLASAFARFKAWLTRIYRTAAGLNVKITPEIREVMDRMLATDSEIAAMREDLSMRPLFTDAAPVGMSDAVFATYQRMARRGAEQAEASLMNRTMEKVRRETQKWFKTEKAAVHKEVEARVNKMPVYRLTEMATNQKWLSETDQVVPDVQIDRDALVEQFDVGVIAEIGRSRIGGRREIYTKNGMRPEDVAHFFGFKSAPEMVEALQNAGKRKDFIATEVDRIMVERHGDPLNDGSIEEAAALAVHSDQQAAMVTAEARAIAKRLGRPTRDIKAKIYSQRARAMLGRMSVREASRPAAFLQAERRAAKAAEQAFAKVTRGGRNVEASLAAAMQAKEQQILNQYLYREAREFEKALQRGRERMQSYSKKTVRAKLEGGYIEQIDALLERFDFRIRSKGQVERSESLRDYMDRMIDDGREAELSIDPRLSNESRKTHYTSLSVDELQGFFDTVANIDHMGRFKQTLVEKRRVRDLNESASTVAGLVRDRFGSGKSDKQSGSARNFLNLILFVDTISADIDKQEVGAFYDQIKRGIDEGATLEQKMNVEFATAIEDLFSVFSSKEKSDLNIAKIIPGGNGHLWTRQQVIMLALNTGNAENLQRILDPRVHESVRLTRNQMDATLETLSKRDMDFAQSVRDYLETYWSDLSEVTKRRKGVTLKKVDASPITNKHGSYRGGYFPISYDSSKSKAALVDAESAFDKFLSAGRGSVAKVSDGMAQARQSSGGGRALNYDFSVLLKHGRDVIRVIALSEAVDNSDRILAHNDVVQAFQDGGVSHLLKTLKLFVQDVAGGPAYNEDPVNSMARIIKNNFTISRLAFNVKTVVLQVTGLGHSAVVIGKMNLLYGFNDYLKNPAEILRGIIEKSAFMAERQTTFQKDTYDQANDLRLSSPVATRARKAKNQMSAYGFAPMTKTQFYVVDVPTWLGAYRAELKKNKGNEGKAIHFADRMVARAQGSGLMPDRNAIERGTLSRTVRQADFIRIWTTLGGYMAVKANRSYLSVRNFKAETGKAEGFSEYAAATVKMTTDLTILIWTEAAMMGLMAAIIDDDEDAEDIKNFMIRETVSSVFGGIPFIREIANSFQGYGGGGVLASAFEVPSAVWTQIEQGDNDPAFRRAVAGAIGLATGLPTTQSMRAIEEVLEGEDGSMAEAMLGRNPFDR